MRLGGRLQAAIEVLTDIAARHRPVPDALKDWGLSHRFAGSGDRAAINNIVLDALRMKLSHAHVMDGDAPADLAIGVMLRQWGMTPDALTAALDADKFAPSLPAASILAARLGRGLDGAPDHVCADLPAWLVDEFARGFGVGWIAEAEALAGRPPLDLRVNSLLSARPKVLVSIEAEGAAPTRLAINGIRIPAGEGPARQVAATSEIAFARGWFEIQDEGSQIAARLVGARPGETVLDYCAGGGGKSLAIAADMENRGVVHAYDSDRRRLAPMVERLKRAEVTIVDLIDRAARLTPLLGGMDRVLVDAPCTGTGTWRRRPDAKWRLSAANLADRTRDQDGVLDSAAAFVRPGGELAYVTCSLLPSENGDRALSFLARNPTFELLDLGSRWHAAVADDTAVLPQAPAGPGLLLSPHRTATDGFYFTAFRRKD